MDRRYPCMARVSSPRAAAPVPLPHSMGGQLALAAAVLVLGTATAVGDHRWRPRAAANSSSSSSSSSNTNAGRDDEFVDFSTSTLELLPEAALGTAAVAALQERLDVAVRQRVPGFAMALVAQSNQQQPHVRVQSGATAGPGSYVLSEQNGTAALLVVRAGDDEAVLAGIARLIRELRVNHSTGTAHLPTGLRVEHNASAALWPLRGHQLTTAHHPSVFRTWKEFRTYVHDLAVFGTNQIELAHITLDCDSRNTTDCALPTAALVNFTQNLQELRVNASFWWPLNLCAMRNQPAVFEQLPWIQSLLIEGGVTRTNASRALTASCAAMLRKHQPSSKLWVAATASNASELEDAFSVLRTLEYVDGLAANPMAPVPLPQYVQAAPARFKGRIRTYPDICHAVHTQFPVPNWHWAWSVVHSRNPVIPLPLHSANIVRLYSNGSSPNYGFGAYSEGVSDDLNKAIWSLLSAEPETSVHSAVEQYARYHFGVEHEAAMTAGLFGLEQNWVGDIQTSDTVAHTLTIFQSVEAKLTESQLRANWRMQAYLFRSYFDAHVQARFRHEQCVQEQAYATLRERLVTMGGRNSSVIIAATRKVLLQTHNDSVAAKWRARVLQLAELINATVDAAVLQSQSTDLNLQTFDTPLSDKPFLMAELNKAESLGEAQRLRALAALADRGAVAPGGFYDKLGTGVLRGEAPHLVLGEGAVADPGFFYTSHQQALGPVVGSKGKMVPTGDALPAEWRSFSVAQQSSPHTLSLKYQGLDPSAHYHLRVLFFKVPFKNFKDERNTLVAGRTVLQRNAVSSDPMAPVSFTVPRNETIEGSLAVMCIAPAPAGQGDSIGYGCSISAVWLEPTTDL